MEFPKLEDKIKEEINNLEFSDESFKNPILWYGVDSVAIFYVMKNAEKNIQESKSLEDFIKKVNLKVGGDLPKINESPYISLNDLVSKGLFLPKNLHYKSLAKKNERNIYLFNRDYLNMMTFTNWTDNQYAKDLMNKKISFEEFQDPKIIQNGIKFSKDLWKTSIEQYQEFKKDEKTKRGNELREILINYYSSIINSN